MKYAVKIIFEFSNATNELPSFKNKDITQIDQTLKIITYNSYTVSH